MDLRRHLRSAQRTIWLRWQRLPQYLSNRSRQFADRTGSDASELEIPHASSNLPI